MTNEALTPDTESYWIPRRECYQIVSTICILLAMIGNRGEPTWGELVIPFISLAMGISYAFKAARLPRTIPANR